MKTKKKYRDIFKSKIESVNAIIEDLEIKIAQLNNEDMPYENLLKEFHKKRDDLTNKFHQAK